MKKTVRSYILGGITELVSIVLCFAGVSFGIPGINYYNVMNLPSNPFAILLVTLFLFAIFSLLWFLYFRFLESRKGDVSGYREDI